MATNIKSHAPAVDLTRFWGGDKRGTCVQITVPATEDNKAKGIFHDAVQLTRGQAAALARDLHDFATHREEETYE
mgnify:FL=1|tara:strand:+ start:3845 stop:4069 length:225 start_codon:yes stop_codon:yes gene_type:complete